MTKDTVGRWFKKYSRALALVFAILISLLIFVFRGELVQFQGYGLLGLFILSVLGTSTILIPVPVFVAAFIAGAVFNPWAVTLVVSLGAAIGELTGYLAGYGAEDLLKKEVKLQKMKGFIDKYGLWVIFLLAAIPNPIFDLAGIVAGASGMSVKKFFITEWLGKIVKFGAIAYFGAHSITLIDKFI